MILISKHLLFGGQGEDMNTLECGSIFELQINVMPGSVLGFLAYFFLAVSYAIYVMYFCSSLMSCLFFNPIKHEKSKWGGDYICLSI